MYGVAGVSPLTQGRELKYDGCAKALPPESSPLTQGRELKLVALLVHTVIQQSPLTQGRELKLHPSI